jgi:hypothetical protein
VKICCGSVTGTVTPVTLVVDPTVKPLTHLQFPQIMYHRFYERQNIIDEKRKSKKADEESIRKQIKEHQSRLPASL